MVSVGGKGEVAFWDIRTCSSNADVKMKLGNYDLNCVDWNSKNWVAIGSESGSVYLVDPRKTDQPVLEVNSSSPIQCLKWNPNNSNQIAIGSDNLYIHQLEDHINGRSLDKTFTHLIAKGQVSDIDWNWDGSIVCTVEGEPHGVIQVFRMNHLLNNQQQLHQLLSSIQ